MTPEQFSQEAGQICHAAVKGMQVTGLKIKCPNCKRTDFVTTEKYNPNVTPNGSMVKSLLPYFHDWLCSSTTLCSEMACPECLAQLAPSGRLMVVMPAGKSASEIFDDGQRTEVTGGVFVGEMPDASLSELEKKGYPCDTCGKTFATARARNSHMGMHAKGK